MEEPGGRFAHGFFRRTGDAGSVTARGGDRKVSGGLDPIPIQRHTAWATRLARLRGEPARPGLLPHCDASRARPSKKRPSRYSRACAYRQEQSENITFTHCPIWSLPRHGRAFRGHPDADKRCASRVGITGTRPVMTWWGMGEGNERAPATLCSHFVLDNPPNLGYTVAQDLLLTRGALARRRSVGAGTVP